MSERLDIAGLTRGIRDQLAELLDPDGTGASPLAAAPRTIRESASHDFSHYRFLTQPTSFLEALADEVVEMVREDEWERAGLPDSHELETSGLPGGLTIELGESEPLPTSFSSFVEAFRGVFQRVVADVPRRARNGTVIRDRHVDGPTDEDLLWAGMFGFESWMAAELFAVYEELERPSWFLSRARDAAATVLSDHLDDMVADDVLDIRRLVELFTSPPWESATPGVVADLRAQAEERASAEAGSRREPSGATEVYPFRPYMGGTVNFGLQLVYRQQWTPLGIQQGEIIRTLPLGPKQTEKVTVKAIRRTKATRQTEIVTSIETATESSAATKDSQEVVREASESFNWHVEASADASFGFGSASLKAGMGGEAAESSKQASSFLGEVAEKTTSKLRQDTKIVVSTETEETDEFARVSEISNPNDEIAVTYVYSRLQRQYEIYTYLSEANCCVFVAEPLPTIEEVTDLSGAWIRRHDWILARALLDESFRSDLEVIRGHDPDLASLPTEPEDGKISALMESLTDGGAPGIPDYSSLAGSLPDIFATPQQAYEREVDRRRAREKDRELYRRSVARLSQHIVDNVLHYWRAILAAEDPEARLMRYRGITVPTRWEFVPTGGGGGGGTAEGRLVPRGGRVPVSELINPAGPIGFAGNYAVYYLKRDGRHPDLEAALDYMRLPYLRWRAVGAFRRRPGEDINFEVIVHVSPNRLDQGFAGSYEMTWDSSTRQMVLTGERMVIEPDGTPGTVIVGMPFPVSSLAGFELPGEELRVEIRSTEGARAGPEDLVDGDTFRIDVFVDPVLEDPQRRQIAYQNSPMDPAQEPGFHTPDVLAQHSELFAEIEQALAHSGATSWDELDHRTRQLIRDRLPDYLLRLAHTRRFLLDTNNVLLSRAVDPASTLEPFKGLHRVIDVLAAYAEMEHKRAENRRLERRLESDQLGDPDVERVTVITGDSLRGFPAVDRDDDDGPPP